ncbi:MAG: hypothetical protein GVY18_07880 [Bacteroidetes bacterium]|jgi:hypothetical protein|nr:hypothetical protein [Bacteroidota bacterium]
MRLVPVVLLLLTAVLLGGCEESVDPILGTDRAFTLYGLLNPQADTQAVRVFPIEGDLTRTRPEPLDAEVASENLTTGAATAWQDSLVLYRSSLFEDTYGHVYFAPLQVQHEHTYRVRATRSDGAATMVEVTVPPVSEPELRPFDVERFSVTMPVFWPRAPQLNQIQVVYRLTVDGAPQEVVVDYPIAAQQRDAGGIVMAVNFLEDARTIRSTVNEGLGGRIALIEIVQRVLVTNAEWNPPGGVYDPDVLVQPGVFSNVEDGFGFVGAGYPASIAWVPEEAIVQQAGFEYVPPEDDEVRSK